MASGGREKVSASTCGNSCEKAIKPPISKIELLPSSAMISSNHTNPWNELRIFRAVNAPRPIATIIKPIIA